MTSTHRRPERPRHLSRVTIDNPTHPRARAARRLHSAAGRAKTGTFLAEGVQAVREALARPGVVVDLFATADWLAGDQALDTHCLPLHQVTDQVLSTIAETMTPQGVVAVCRDVTVGLDTLLAGRPSLVVVLAEVRDPGNAGTIIRTADAAGADGVIFTEASVDPLGGKCVRSTVGSLFHVPVVVGQPASVLDDLQAAGFRVLAADSSGPVDVQQASAQGMLDGPTAWVVGNEAHGLPEAYRQRADATVRVPVFGRAESLNVSVAAGLCLYASAIAQRAAMSGREPAHA